MSSSGALDSEFTILCLYEGILKAIKLNIYEYDETQYIYTTDSEYKNSKGESVKKGDLYNGSVYDSNGTEVYFNAKYNKFSYSIEEDNLIEYDGTLYAPDRNEENNLLPVKHLPYTKNETYAGYVKGSLLFDASTPLNLISVCYPYSTFVGWLFEKDDTAISNSETETGEGGTTEETNDTGIVTDKTIYTSSADRYTEALSRLKILNGNDEVTKQNLLASGLAKAHQNVKYYKTSSVFPYTNITSADDGGELIPATGETFNILTTYLSRDDLILNAYFRASSYTIYLNIQEVEQVYNTLAANENEEAAKTTYMSFKDDTLTEHISKYGIKSYTNKGMSLGYYQQDDNGRVKIYTISADGTVSQSGTLADISKYVYDINGDLLNSSTSVIAVSGTQNSSYKLLNNQTLYGSKFSYAGLLPDESRTKNVNGKVYIKLMANYTETIGDSLVHRNKYSPLYDNGAKKTNFVLTELSDGKGNSIIVALTKNAVNEYTVSNGISDITEYVNNGKLTDRIKIKTSNSSKVYIKPNVTTITNGSDPLTDAATKLTIAVKVYSTSTGGYPSITILLDETSKGSKTKEGLTFFKGLYQANYLTKDGKEPVQNYTYGNRKTFNNQITTDEYNNLINTNYNVEILAGFSLNCIALDVNLDYSGDTNGNINDVYNEEIKNKLDGIDTPEGLIAKLVELAESGETEEYNKYVNTLSQLFSTYTLFKFKGANYYLSQLSNFENMLNDVWSSSNSSNEFATSLIDALKKYYEHNEDVVSRFESLITSGALSITQSKVDGKMRELILSEELALICKFYDSKLRYNITDGSNNNPNINKEFTISDWNNLTKDDEAAGKLIQNGIYQQFIDYITSYENNDYLDIKAASQFSSFNSFSDFYTYYYLNAIVTLSKSNSDLTDEQAKQLTDEYLNLLQVQDTINNFSYYYNECLYDLIETSSKFGFDSEEYDLAKTSAFLAYGLTFSNKTFTSGTIQFFKISKLTKYKQQAYTYNQYKEMGITKVKQIYRDVIENYSTCAQRDYYGNPLAIKFDAIDLVKSIASYKKYPSTKNTYAIGISTTRILVSKQMLAEKGIVESDFIANVYENALANVGNTSLNVISGLETSLLNDTGTDIVQSTYSSYSYELYKLLSNKTSALNNSNGLTGLSSNAPSAKQDNTYSIEPYDIVFDQSYTYLGNILSDSQIYNTAQLLATNYTGCVISTGTGDAGSKKFLIITILDGVLVAAQDTIADYDNTDLTEYRTTNIERALEEQPLLYYLLNSYNAEQYLEQYTNGTIKYYTNLDQYSATKLIMSNSQYDALTNQLNSNNLIHPNQSSSDILRYTNRGYNFNVSNTSYVIDGLIRQYQARSISGIKNTDYSTSISTYVLNAYELLSRSTWANYNDLVTTSIVLKEQVQNGNIAGKDNENLQENKFLFWNLNTTIKNSAVDNIELGYYYVNAVSSEFSYTSSTTHTNRTKLSTEELFSVIGLYTDGERTDVAGTNKQLNNFLGMITAGSKDFELRNYFISSLANSVANGSNYDNSTLSTIEQLLSSNELYKIKTKYQKDEGEPYSLIIKSHASINNSVTSDNNIKFNSSSEKLINTVRVLRPDNMTGTDGTGESYSTSLGLKKSDNFRILVRTLPRVVKLDGKEQYLDTTKEYITKIVVGALTAIVVSAAVIAIEISTLGTSTLGTLAVLKALSLTVGAGLLISSRFISNPIIQGIFTWISIKLIAYAIPIVQILTKAVEFAAIVYFSASYSTIYVTGLVSMHMRSNAQGKLNNGALVISTDPSDYRTTI